MPDLKVGQKWQELDKRFHRVIEIDRFCEKTGKVICRTIDPATNLKTKANPARFNGKSGGYKLIS